MPRPPYGHHYRVGDHDLFLHAAGAGVPAAVFLAGAGAVGLDYWPSHRQTAEFTTSVIYDRAGTGWSGPVPRADKNQANTERTAAAVADELAGLLEEAGVAGPYVLVGHSLGADYARVFISRFPDRVAGLVLVEPHHEDYTAHLPPELAARHRAFDPGRALVEEIPDEIAEFYRAVFDQELTAWPEEIRRPLVDHHVSRDGLRAGLIEAMAARRLDGELRAAGPLPDLPLIVLTATGVDTFKQLVSADLPPALLQAEIEGKTLLYDRMAASVPRGENRLVEGVGHTTLPMHRPDAITEAIRDVIARR
ncbi:alpha/beta hydrolase [Actinocorallia aurea]